MIQSQILNEALNEAREHLKGCERATGRREAAAGSTTNGLPLAFGRWLRPDKTAVGALVGDAGALIPVMHRVIRTNWDF